MSSHSKPRHLDIPDRPDRNADGHGGGDIVAEAVRPKLKKPPRYKVLLLNDDYTPMAFVVRLLMRVFQMSKAQAEQVTSNVHNQGRGICGVFCREIAETKVRMTMHFAQQNRHPLQCKMERE